MVGYEGDQPVRLVRVYAEAPEGWIKRELDLLPRPDKEWEAGDCIGLLDGKWVPIEKLSDLPVSAVIKGVKNGNRD
jgi:hypothetical protein